MLSHATDLGEAEISVLAAAGSSIAHNPTAVFSQLGRCPVPELLEAGVNVALGSDATAPDRPSDMFRQMFGLTRYHRALRRDPALIPPGLALEMATVRAAEALGMGGEVGSLTPGLLADVIVLDGARPHLTPLIHPVHQIVYYASGSDVSHVVVGGEVLVDDGVVTSVDVAEILAEAREEHSAAIARSGLEALLGDRDGTWGAIRYPEGSGLGS